MPITFKILFFILIFLVFYLAGCEANEPDVRIEPTMNNAAATMQAVETAQLPLHHTHTPPAKNVLATAKSSRGVFTLHVGSCSDDECTLEIRWLSDTDKYDSVKLEWGLQSPTLEPPQEEPWRSFPGLLTGAAETLGITIGEEYQAVTTSIQAVDLADGLPALLVRQQAGFEHIKRRFDLFVVENNRLSRIWSDAEGPGPWLSDVAIVDTKSSGQHLIHFKGFAPPYGEEADTLKATLLRWSSADNSLKSELADVPAIQIIPHFDSVSAARTTRDQSSACIGGYWILHAAWLDQRPAATSGYTLVGLAATKELARLELVRVRDCLKQGKPNLTRLVGEPH